MSVHYSKTRVRLICAGDATRNGCVWLINCAERAWDRYNIPRKLRWLRALKRRYVVVFQLYSDEYCKRNFITPYEIVTVSKHWREKTAEKWAARRDRVRRMKGYNHGTYWVRWEE